MLTTPLDIFYNPLDVPGETQHVFLNPSLHHFQQTCRIGETGFGTGLNLVAAAELFLRSSPPDATLTFISTEVAPLSLLDMAAYHETWPEHLQPLAESLRAVYPACLQTLQTLHPRVFVQVLPGDAATSLLGYKGAPMDAWFFDGFAPAVNPAMWTPPLFQAAARLSIPGHTTYGTFTAAGWVRQNLMDAGFGVEKIKGYGRKRHCLRGVMGEERHEERYEARGARREEEDREEGGSKSVLLPPSRLAPRASCLPTLIIGAGIAGCALARILKERGVSVLLLDSAPAVASGASGNPVAALHPLLSVTPSREALFFLEALRYTREWLKTQPHTLYDFCGVQLNDPRAPRLAAAAHYAGELELLSMDTVLLKQSGWVRPWALCQALAKGLPFRGHAVVQALEQTADGYTVRLENGETIAASRIVLACGFAVNTLLPAAKRLPLQALGGQLTFLQATPESEAMLATVRCGDGYLLPAVDGLHTTGASYRRNDTNTGIRALDTAENLRKAAALAPLASRLVPTADRASVRCRTADVLPVAGAIADNLFVLTGFASRGLCSAPYAAWLLSEHLLNQKPLPDYLTPQRFSGRTYAFQKAL